MRAVLLIAVASCLALEVGAAACFGNDACLRAVKSIAKNRNGTADCVSFFQATITPAASTFTTTLVITSTFSQSNNATSTKKASSTIHEPRGLRPEEEYEAFDNFGYGQALEERRVTASATSMPTYASHCSSLAAYSSACSCLGISHKTITATAKPVVETLTVTRILSNGTALPFFSNNTTGRFQNATKSTATRSLGSTSSTHYAFGPPTFPHHKTSHPTRQSSKSVTPLHGNTETSNSPKMSTALAPEYSSTVYVLNTMTLVTTGNPLWTNTSALTSLTTQNVTRGYWNSSKVTSASATGASLSSRLNSTAARTSQGNSTIARWLNSTSSTLLLANSTRPLWLNTSMPTVTSNTTTGRWLNTTATISATLANSTSVRWPNSTSFRWLNTTSTPTATPTPTTDTSCGKTASPFVLQVSQPGGKFDGWYLYLSGNGLLFTNLRSSSSSFSVEATGHLCVVGYLDDTGRPPIAAVGTHDPSSNVWLVGQRTLDDLGKDYAAVKCTNGGGTLNCAANTTNLASHWLGCGLQLDLSTDGSGRVLVGALNCTSIGLEVV